MYPHPSTNYPQTPPPSAPPPPQYVTGIPAPATNVNWSSSLCACSSDVPNCCLTCWCPWITFGQIAEIVDKGNTSCGVHGGLYMLIDAFLCCGCLYSRTYRTKMRIHYGLRESPCNDCLVHFYCELCALCQEYRELQHRGFDLSIGWEGHLVRQNQVLNMAPMAPEGMYR